MPKKDLTKVSDDSKKTVTKQKSDKTKSDKTKSDKTKSDKIESDNKSDKIKKSIPKKTIKKSVIKKEKSDGSDKSDNSDNSDNELDEESDKSDEESPKKRVIKKDKKNEGILINTNDESWTKYKKDGYKLVIVESPGKIKKLESILGAGYLVTTSYGHIIDLHPKKMSIDFENNFEPEYYVIENKEKFKDKKKVVKDLINLAKKASKIIIASDDDREGEMIAWSYKVILGLKEEDYERITFNSITKAEIKKAISNPGKINMLMLDSQKARRIVDRIVGFKISPCLGQVLGMRNLSAGRVQSIVVKLICEKEEEINEFFKGDRSSFFKIVGNMSTDDNKINMKCDLLTNSDNDSDNESDNENDNENDVDDDNDDKNSDDDQKKKKKKSNKKEDVDENEEEDDDGQKSKSSRAEIESYDSAKKIMKNISKSTFKIADVNIRKSKRYPSAPYTTSTVQQDAATKLGFSVKRTMTALQHLYEAGYTTYLRTDSTNLSEDALTQCEKYIKENFGDDYHNLKKYVNKKGNTQEAHEAIRPVDVKNTSITKGGKNIGQDEQKMYQLVWKRTVASQMACAEVDVHVINISISKEKDYFFRTSIEDITYPGFLVVYNIGIHGQPFDDINKNFKINVPKKGQKVIANEVKSDEEYKKPPLRYSEAGLVKKMDPKNLNIGRPATYAEIINTIQRKNYVEIKDINGVEKKSRFLTWKPAESDEIKLDEKVIYLGREKKKFTPTELGIEVNDILNKNFPEIMNYKFTANMELELDDIADGNSKWVKCIDKLWKKLEPLIKRMEGEQKKERIIGKHPETGYDITASIGKYGPMLTMARSNKKSENATAPIKKPYTMEKITLKQALEILKYPKILGVHKKKIVELKTGKNGFYVTCGNESANIPEDVKPDDIDLDMALEFIENRNKQKQEKLDKYLYYHKDGDIEYIINKGKYGDDNKYIMIKDTKKLKVKPIFLPFPTKVDIEDLTFESLKEIIKEAKQKKFQKKDVKDNKADKTKSDKTKSDKTKSDKTKSDKTKSDKTKSDKTNSDKSDKSKAKVIRRRASTKTKK
jgi:DNA topoisomerase-1